MILNNTFGLLLTEFDRVLNNRNSSKDTAHKLFGALKIHNAPQPIDIEVDNCDENDSDIRSIGLRLQQNKVKEWHLWGFVYFNKTKKIHEGLLCKDLRSFRTLNDVILWRQQTISANIISQRLEYIDKEYHENMWEIKDDGTEDGPTECYDVWCMEHIPEDPWRQCKSFSTRQEAFKYILEILRKCDTYEKDYISTFYDFYIYALSEKDRRLRIQSVEAYNAPLEQQICEAEKNAPAFQEVMGGLCQQALARLEKLSENAPLDFTLNDSHFNISMRIFRESDDQLYIISHFHIPGVREFGASNYCFSYANLIEQLEEGKSNLGYELIKTLCSEIREYLRVVPR